MGTMNVSLPDGLKSFVDEQVAARGYSTSSEYVRELIRRDQREQDIARLRAMFEEGLASGPARADTGEDWAELEAIARGTRA